MIIITLITSNYCPNILNLVKFLAKLKILVTSQESTEKYVINFFGIPHTLPTNIRLGLKGWPGSNTYYEHS